MYIVVFETIYRLQGAQSNLYKESLGALQGAQLKFYG